MSTHSPGPWAWTRHNTSLVDARGSEVVYNYCADPRLRTSPADERLIAAAPELLDALKRVLDPSLVGAETLDEQNEVDEAAYALIRRIEGEE